MIFKLKKIFKRKFQRTKFVTNILKLYYQSESVIKKKENLLSVNTSIDN